MFIFNIQYLANYRALMLLEITRTLWSHPFYWLFLSP